MVRFRSAVTFLSLTVAVIAIIAWLMGNASANPAFAAATKKANTKSKTKPQPAPHVPDRQIPFSKVDAHSRESVIASAEKIDALIETGYAKHNITPNSVTTDEQFLRRVYLDVVGTIPTLKQVKAFNSNTDALKRSRLIDFLLGQEGYASNFYNYWSDILRLKDGQISNNVVGKPYCEWVKESLETDKPYDKFVYEMLTAEGKIQDQPAAGYILRDSGMPLDAVNNTVRIFLGTQIGCAQCHNHPFDHWTQKEFYEMAAFMAGTATRRGGGDKIFGGGNVVEKLKQELKKTDPKFDGGGKYNRILIGNLFEVHDRPQKLLLPHDYRYDDGKPKEPVTPKTIFGPSVEIAKGESPRVAFARWLTSPENPRFAKTIANRLWKKSFGVGLIEPIDDIKDDSQPENPELLDFLTSEMVRLKFDLKEYLRIIYNTKTWQREATHTEITSGDEYHFPGPVLRRMTAEQVWDSFITLAAFKPGEYQTEPASVESRLVSVDLAKATAQQIYERDQKLRSEELKKTREARDKGHTYKGVLLVRASELPSPRPAGHFLRQFGQSDRDAIEVSSVDGTVPQVLQMFNGPITHMLLEQASFMYKNVAAEKSADARIDVVFQSILTRKPTTAERRTAQAEVKAHGEAGYGNVIWALVNTREFLFIQ